MVTQMNPNFFYWARREGGEISVVREVRAERVKF